MRGLFKALAGAALFVALYGLVDWVAGVTAPVVGPIVLTALIIAPIWALVWLGKVAR